jgi:imidazolonepropionase
MSTAVVENAEEVLRPPQDGLPYLRHDRAAELRLDPVPVVLDGDRIAGFTDADADGSIDASGCALLPGLVDCHTHLPFAGWRAEEY